MSSRTAQATSSALILAVVALARGGSIHACELDQACEFFSGSRSCWSIGCFTNGVCVVQSFVPEQPLLCAVELGLDPGSQPREVVVHIQTELDPGASVVTRDQLQ